MLAKLYTGGLVILNNDLKRVLGKNYFTLLRKLTIKTPQKVGPDKIAKSYKLLTANGNHYICLPRTLLPSLLKSNILTLDNVTFALSSGLRPINIDFIGNLFPNQNIICDWLINNIYTEDKKKDGSAGCTLDLTAGLGKTFVA